eukprot:35439-Eustigmatos_ZCMA.PRE.1
MFIRFSVRATCRQYRTKQCVHEEPVNAVWRDDGAYAYGLHQVSMRMSNWCEGLGIKTGNVTIVQTESSERGLSCVWCMDVW